MSNAFDLERQAKAQFERAIDLRCPTRDSGGARCTADARPEHAHRYREEDLPA